MSDVTTDRGRHVALVSVGYSVLAVLPLFLVGALAVQLQRDLRFDTAALGLAVSLCFVTSAVSAAPLGRVVARIGAGAGIKLCAGFALAALAWLAVAASWWHVVGALALTGMANATGQVATNVAIADGVPRSRHGLAFGAKQAAIPIASLTAGLVLPFVGLLAGWRVAFAAAGVVVLVALLLRPYVPRGVTPESARRLGRPTSLLVSMAAVGVLAGATANAVPAFTVDSAVAHGFGETAAGLLLAAGSALAVTVRIAAGWLTDRRESSGFAELIALTAFGAVALAALALAGDSDVLYAVATLAAFATAWGWPGLLHFATVNTHLDSPATATAFVLSWIYVGNFLGPGTIGFIAEHGSWSAAWLYGATVIGLAAVAAVVARRLAER